MLEFEEYKVKLNNLKPELEELYTSLGLEQAKREVEELRSSPLSRVSGIIRRRARRSSPAWARSRARLKRTTR